MTTKNVYICSKCGAEFLTWQGKCGVCGEWNSLVAEKRSKQRKASAAAKPTQTEKLTEVQGSAFSRVSTGIEEFDRVLGGGIVRGSLILLGGEPGIGKSTLVLQTADRLSLNQSVLYVSGEESGGQVKLRGQRLGLKLNNLSFLSEQNIDVIIATLKQIKPLLAIIDSIQTVYSDDLIGEAGGVAQVRLATQKLMEFAKKSGTAVILIGHVTKAGNVAGPRTLEHLVDSVLYLEGERYHSFRILRGMKNRFGATDETGVFEMTTQGLSEVQNPSQVFLAERKKGLPGSCVTATLEGLRSFLVEIQALCSSTVFGYPKRTASGIDLNRLQLIIAVLTKRAHLRLGSQDIYVSIAGGFQIREPAIDLAIALAIFSAFSDQALDPSLVVLGEVGLSGELRQINQIKKRIREAVNLGFRRIIIPASAERIETKVEIIRVATVSEVIQLIKKSARK